MINIFNKNQYKDQFKRFKVPMFNDLFFKKQMNLQYHENALSRIHIIVVEDVEDIEDIKNAFYTFNIIVLDKTYVEKYLIYVVKGTTKSINNIAKCKWVVNISKGM